MRVNHISQRDSRGVFIKRYDTAHIIRGAFHQPVVNTAPSVLREQAVHVLFVTVLR